MKKRFYFTGFFTTFFFMLFLPSFFNNTTSLFDTGDNENETTYPVKVTKIQEQQDPSDDYFGAAFTIKYEHLDDFINGDNVVSLKLHGEWKQEIALKTQGIPWFHYDYDWYDFFFDIKFDLQNVNLNDSFSLTATPTNTDVWDYWVFHGLTQQPIPYTDISYTYYLYNDPYTKTLKFDIVIYHSPVFYWEYHYSGVKDYEVTASFVYEGGTEMEIPTQFSLTSISSFSSEIIIDYDLVLGDPAFYPEDVKYVAYIAIWDLTTGAQDYMVLPEGLDQTFILNDTNLDVVRLTPNNNYELRIYTIPSNFPPSGIGKENLYQQIIVVSNAETENPILFASSAEVDSNGFMFDYTYIPGIPEGNEKAKLKIEDLETNNIYEFDLEQGVNVNIFLDKIYFNDSNFLPGNEFSFKIYTENSLGENVNGNPEYLTIDDEFYDPYLSINSLTNDIDSLVLEYSYIPGSKLGSDGNLIGNEKGYIMVENLNTGEVGKKQISQTDMEEIAINSVTFPNITFSPNQLYEVKLYTENSYGKNMEVSSTISTLDLVAPDIILYANFDNLENPTSLNVASQYYNQGDANSYSIKVDINNGELIQVVENQDTLEIDLSTTKIKSISFSYNWTNDKYFDDSTAEFNNFYDVQGNITEFHPNTDNLIDHSKNNVIFWTTVGITMPIAGLGVVGLGRFVW